MAGRVEIARGDIWTYEFQRPDKRRPVLVLSRPEAIAVLHTVIVAPITSTIRGLPSEVVVGTAEGLKHDSAVNLDHIQTVERARLSRYIGRLGGEKMRPVCRAIAAATGCD
jgi:mRNA interferase MazF